MDRGPTGPAVQRTDGRCSGSRTNTLLTLPVLKPERGLNMNSDLVRPILVGIDGSAPALAAARWAAREAVLRRAPISW